MVDRVIPSVPLRQWVFALPIALRVLLAAQPNLVTTALQVVQSNITLIARVMKRLVRQGALVQEQDQWYVADGIAEDTDASALRPMQAGVQPRLNPLPALRRRVENHCSDPTVPSDRQDPESFRVRGATAAQSTCARTNDVLKRQV